jgi:hypothetical protein
VSGVEPLGVVIFGASGDLTSRKLLPALYSLLLAGALPGDFFLLGAARTVLIDGEFRERALQGLAETSLDRGRWDEFAGRLFYQPLTIDDPEGQAEVVMFSDVLEKARRTVAENNVVVVEGRVSRRAGGEGKVLVNTIMSVGEEPGPAWKEVHVTLDLDATPEATIEDMKRVLFAHTGDSRVFFHVREAGRRAYVIRARSQGVRVDPALVSGLSASIGASNVRLVPAGLGA